MFAANVHCQPGPKEIKTRERGRLIAFVERRNERTQQFVQRLVIVGEQSFRAW